MGVHTHHPRNFGTLIDQLVLSTPLFALKTTWLNTIQLDRIKTTHGFQRGKENPFHEH